MSKPPATPSDAVDGTGSVARASDPVTREVGPVRAAATIVVLLALAGCTGTSEGSDDEEGLGGMGVPQQLRGEHYPGPRTELTVRVHLARNGCFLGRLERESGRRLVLWPAGTEQGDHGDELRLPGGATVRHGDVLSARGVVMATDRLAGSDGDGYWAMVVGFCTPQASEVLVLDRAEAG